MKSFFKQPSIWTLIITLLLIGVLLGGILWQLSSNLSHTVIMPGPTSAHIDHTKSTL